ncbi:hypothetical protein GCM10023069_69470 [Shinella granuli]
MRYDGKRNLINGLEKHHALLGQLFTAGLKAQEHCCANDEQRECNQEIKPGGDSKTRHDHSNEEAESGRYPEQPERADGIMPRAECAGSR